MDLKSITANIRLVISAAVGAMLFTGISTTSALSMENPKPIDWKDIQMVGVIGPDGSTNLWAVSISNGGDVFGLLAPHSSKMRDGIRYFSLSSWQDMARVLSAANRHQALVILQLVQNIDQLTKRVGIIEKRRRGVVYAGPMDYRLKVLEDKVEDMMPTITP